MSPQSGLARDEAGRQRILCMLNADPPQREERSDVGKIRNIGDWMGVADVGGDARAACCLLLVGAGALAPGVRVREGTVITEVNEVPLSLTSRRLLPGDDSLQIKTGRGPRRGEEFQINGSFDHPADLHKGWLASGRSNGDDNERFSGRRCGIRGDKPI